jgi:hypothetical protein
MDNRWPAPPDAATDPTGVEAARRLSVTVTVSNPGYQPWTDTSPVAKVAKTQLAATHRA